MLPPHLSLPSALLAFPLREGVLLSSLGTFQLGGAARWVLELSSPESLRRVRAALAGSGLPAVLIGEGSNLLFSDEGWPGLVVRYVNPEALPEPLGGNLWQVSAAMPLDALSAWAVDRGLAGLEAFSGIPGTLGGAVVGNAGAWGRQMEQVVVSVQVIDATGAEQTWLNADCGFSYRDSLLKTEDVWVASLRFRTEAGDRSVLQAERARILALRAEKHPDWRKMPCIGSFFRNVEPSSAAERRRAAGWFLEEAGAKTCRVGGAAVFSKHANILIKATETCRAADVAALARLLQERVRSLQGLDLVREVRYLGDIPGESAGPSFY
jgi:UDP-N-acetylmuramate dehydrogenase